MLTSRTQPYLTLHQFRLFQLLTSARERAVPSTRIGRLVTFGGLGLGKSKTLKYLCLIHQQQPSEGGDGWGKRVGCPVFFKYLEMKKDRLSVKIAEKFILQVLDVYGTLKGDSILVVF